MPGARVSENNDRSSIKNEAIPHSNTDLLPPQLPFFSRNFSVETLRIKADVFQVLVVVSVTFFICAPVFYQWT